MGKNEKKEKARRDREKAPEQKHSKNNAVEGASSQHPSSPSNQGLAPSLHSQDRFVGQLLLDSLEAGGGDRNRFNPSSQTPTERGQDEHDARGCRPAQNQRRKMIRQITAQQSADSKSKSPVNAHVMQPTAAEWTPSNAPSTPRQPQSRNVPQTMQHDWTNGPQLPNDALNQPYLGLGQGLWPLPFPMPDMQASLPNTMPLLPPAMPMTAPFPSHMIGTFPNFNSSNTAMTQQPQPRDPRLHPPGQAVGFHTETPPPHQSATPNSKRAPTAPQPAVKSRVASPPQPAPTPAYLSKADQPPARLSQPQPLLIISDLNGTLIARKPRTSSFERRPGLTTFLDYAFRNHAVMVWTSSQRSTMVQILSRLLPAAQREACVAAWARDTLGLSKLQYRDKVQVYKRLEQVWEDDGIQGRHPRRGENGRWGQHNTLLIDDSVLKAAAQPFNLVEVPEVTLDRLPQEVENSVFAQVAGYIEEARWWSDVSSFARRTPFRPGQGWERRAQEGPGRARVGAGAVEPELQVAA